MIHFTFLIKKHLFSGLCFSPKCHLRCDFCVVIFPGSLHFCSPSTSHSFSRVSARGSVLSLPPEQPWPSGNSSLLKSTQGVCSIWEGNPAIFKRALFRYLCWKHPPFHILLDTCRFLQVGTFCLIVWVAHSLLTVSRERLVCFFASGISSPQLIVRILPAASQQHDILLFCLLIASKFSHSVAWSFCGLMTNICRRMSYVTARKQNQNPASE